MDTVKLSTNNNHFSAFEQKLTFQIHCMVYKPVWLEVMWQHLTFNTNLAKTVLYVFVCVHTHTREIGLNVM